MLERALEIIRSYSLVYDAVPMPVSNIRVYGWVRDACSKCIYQGKSWSCPPAVGSLGEARERLSEYTNAVFVVFKTSKNRRDLERVVLEIESDLKEAGFPDALGFFVSPCTACNVCRYPGPCTRPELCRPTGESWGIDLVKISREVGLPVKIVRRGNDFRPVTLILLE